MFEDEILKQFLAKAVEDAKKQIKDTGTLTIENAIPLLLHSQYNHILHLEEKMATKDDIKQLETDIKHLRWLIMYGFGLIAIIVPLSITIILHFFKP
jgi:hypothetical protein